jgi:hypothetical protein
MALNTLTPVFKRIDESLPFNALSLIAIMEPHTTATAIASPAA